MAKTKFYTSKGDRGDTTRLGGTTRISKSSALIEAVGTLDEATAAIGLARAMCQSDLLCESMSTVQHHIFTMLAHLSAVPEQRGRYAGLGKADVLWLEALIAEIEEMLPKLTGMVLPGESSSGAAFHVARTAVRRAERRLVALSEEEAGFDAHNLAYINRLSSLMFVASILEDISEKGHVTYAQQRSE